jgi:hypothetical protein
VLHEVRAADLGCRIARVGADADPDLDVAVTVDDIVGAAAFQPVAAEAAAIGSSGVLGAGRMSPRPAILSMPAWSRTSQPLKPAPPTVLGTRSSPLITSSNADPELASVSCHRSRLTTICSSRPPRFWLIFMSSLAPTVSYWWMAQSNPAAPANRSIATLAAMRSSPPSAS